MHIEFHQLLLILLSFENNSINGSVNDVILDGSGEKLCDCHRQQQTQQEQQLWRRTAATPNTITAAAAAATTTITPSPAVMFFLSTTSLITLRYGYNQSEMNRVVCTAMRGCRIISSSSIKPNQWQLQTNDFDTTVYISPEHPIHL